jgi:hypothetical protein
MRILSSLKYQAVNEVFLHRVEAYHFQLFNFFLLNVIKDSVMSVLNYPLSNVQVELMKLFSTNLSDSELI